MSTEISRLVANAEAISRANVSRFGDDPAIGSGVRRKPSARAEARRFSAYDREAKAWLAVDAERQRIERADRAAERAVRDALVPFTDDEIKAATYIRDRHGWHRVVRVNAKSVTVETPWSWADRVDRAAVLEVRAA